MPLAMLDGHGQAQRPPSYASERDVELISPLSESSNAGTPPAHAVRSNSYF